MVKETETEEVERFQTGRKEEAVYEEYERMKSIIQRQRAESIWVFGN